MDAYKAVTSNIAAVPILKTTSIGSCETWEATGALRPIEVMADFGSARTDKSHGRLQAHTHTHNLPALAGAGRPECWRSL